MDISIAHLAVMAATIAAVLRGGLYAARSVRSAEGFSLGGRSAGVPMVVGSIARTCIGGGATMGTAQLAGSAGLSAVWFTIGVGISLFVMGLIYARPLRYTGLETITQYLVQNYGRGAGKFASLATSFGILFSAVSSILPGLGLIAALTGCSSLASSGILLLSVLSAVAAGLLGLSVSPVFIGLGVSAALVLLGLLSGRRRRQEITVA